MEEVVAPPWSHKQVTVPVLFVTVAVKVTEPPAHVDGLLTDTDGFAYTVADALAPGQVMNPFFETTVTLAAYEPADPGVTVIEVTFEA